MVLLHPPLQDSACDLEHEYVYISEDIWVERDFLFPEDPVSEDLWRILLQQAACLSLSLPSAAKQNVASFLLSTSLHKKEVSDSIAKIYGRAPADWQVYQEFERLPMEMQRNR